VYLNNIVHQRKNKNLNKSNNSGANNSMLATIKNDVKSKEDYQPYRLPNKIVLTEREIKYIHKRRISVKFKRLGNNITPNFNTNTRSSSEKKLVFAKT